MPFQVKRMVHSVHEHQFPVDATTADGRKVKAHVPGLVVELVGDTRTHTEDVIPNTDADLAAAKALFVVGKTITVTYDAAE